MNNMLPGGSQAPKKILGRIPSNWHVAEFGAVPPGNFLSHLDFFVYFTHPDLVESFGRVIFEAMAAGVPVIIPPEYKVLFHDAAIYAVPSEVRDVIDCYINDEQLYLEQEARALQYVEQNFGYSIHRTRLNGHF